jgi:hypothetical protein
LHPASTYLDWENAVLIRGDVGAEAARLKRQEGGPSARAS